LNWVGEILQASTLVAAMQQIADWLKKLGMSEYAERFAENSIDDLSILRDLTDQDLKDVGVPLGHRRKMLRAIAELSGAAPAAPQATAQPEPTPQDTAERRQLTVMFCDLVGSTALSVRLDPEDLRGIIGTYHRCCTEMVERNDGFVAKYMGDGVLAYFGYPKAHEHDAERAVQAGLALVKGVPTLTTAGGSPLQVRIGIATGLVVVGDLIGAGAAQEQAVVGETPNLAARLQALAEPGTVVIAATTRRLTGGLFDYRDLGTTTLKGFAENVPAWQVLGASAIESRFEAMRTAVTPLVGRDEEIDLLLRRWEQAKGGDGCVVLISGEPGIGKSRIAQTVVERISAEPHTRLRYFCSPHHQDSALYPSITQLERAAGFRREDTSEQRLAKLRAVLALGTNDLSEAVPLLADLLSIPTGERYPPLNLTPQKRKDRTLHAQVAQVEGLAARQPVLMVWEDVHWSDPTTREVLDLLIDRVPTLRVLATLTFRPEFTPPWIGRPHVTMLTLNRLPRRRGAEMIACVTGRKTLPKEISDQIVDRTDGVPLFIEELTKTVLESGIVTEAGDHYAVAGPTAPLAIPTSLHGSLLARLDRLAPTREVAQIGAALGRQFSHDLISAVATMAQQQLDEALGQLVNAELIFRRGVPPDAEYTFKHALVQDAAYGTLLKSRRQQIHARVVQALESRFPEITEAQPELLAYHCNQAGLIEKAIGYRNQAGNQAIGRSTMAEAVVQLTHALALVGTLPASGERDRLELDAQVALGTAFIATKGWAASEVEKAYERARELCQQQADHPELPAVLYGLSVYHQHRSGVHVEYGFSRDLLCLAERRQDPVARAVAHWRVAICAMHMGKHEFALEHFEQVMAFHYRAEKSARLLTLADPRISSLNFIALILLWRGYLDQARIRSHTGLAEAQRLGQAYTLGHILHLQCWLHQHLGNPTTVKECAETAMKLTAEQGLSGWEQMAVFWQGWAVAITGEDTGGFAQMHDSIAWCRARGIVNQLPFLLGLLADAYSQANYPNKALPLLTEALALIERTQERWFEAELCRLMAEALLATSQFSSAEASLRRAIEVARQQDVKFWELRAATRLARLWCDQGKRTEGRDLLAPVYGWFTEGFDTPVLQDAKALLDQLA
jgi:class 3 adenylate cyclase/tetratricopeptide (TPR) repeat protein